jgi:hypothetical protein
MELYLNTEKKFYSKAVLCTTLTQEETMEMIVPDSLPDILQIVDTDGFALLRGKEADNGRVSVSGVMCVTALYTPEGHSGVRKLDVNIPFNVSALNAEISVNTKVTASLNISSVNANMINSRKIAAKAEVTVVISCYNDVEVHIPSDPDKSNVESLETFNEVFAATLPVSVKEKTFILSDELELPAVNNPVGEILKSKVRLDVEETKNVGNKLIIRGNAVTTLLYSPEDSVDLIASADFQTAFSQIVELDDGSEDSVCNVALMLTGQYIVADIISDSNNIRNVSSELHVVAQCVVYDRISFDYISDAYSTSYELIPECDELVFSPLENSLTLSETVKDSVEMGNVEKIISCNAMCGGLTYAVVEGKLEIKATINIGVMYADEDASLQFATFSREAATVYEARMDCSYVVEAECGADIIVTASKNGFDIRIPVNFKIIETGVLKILAISGLAYDEEKKLNLAAEPSIVIHRLGSGDTLWKLAKKYSSTVDLITEANNIEDPDIIDIGEILIVPKKR